MEKMPHMRPDDRKIIEEDWYHSDLPCYDSMERFERDFFIDDSMWMEMSRDVEWEYDDSWEGREWLVYTKTRYRGCIQKTADKHLVRKVDMSSFYSPSKRILKKIQEYYDRER
jgi:hypothetical protein